MNAGMWGRDDVQFARLLAEIRAVGLTNEQMEELCISMDLSVREINELLDRAEAAFEGFKAEL